MVGILVSFWGPAYFQGRTVSFREGSSPQKKKGGRLMMKYQIICCLQKPLLAGMRNLCAVGNLWPTNTVWVAYSMVIGAFHCQQLNLISFPSMHMRIPDPPKKTYSIHSVSNHAYGVQIRTTWRIIPVSK